MIEVDQHQATGVAVVTGGGRGIGRDIAIGLAGAGMSVALLGRDRESLDAVAAECRQSGPAALALATDVTNPEQVSRAVATVERHLGPVELLVSNAGLREPAPGAPWETDESAWWAVLETNLRGPYLMARAVVPTMVRRQRGRILHLGSGMAHRPNPDWSAYVVSKAALSRLTDSLAAALEGTGVVVLEVSPGLVRTDMTETMWGPPEEQPWNPVQRIVEATLRYARGELDALNGRFVHATRDDLDDLMSRVQAIRAADARTLRLRPYGPSDPLA